MVIILFLVKVILLIISIFKEFLIIVCDLCYVIFYFSFGLGNWLNVFFMVKFRGDSRLLGSFSNYLVRKVKGILFYFFCVCFWRWWFCLNVVFLDLDFLRFDEL